MINKYGYKMVGIKAASGATKNATPYGMYVQVSYNTKSGAILTHENYSQSNFVRYEYDAIIHVCNARCPMTMQEVADAVYKAMCEYSARVDEEVC